MVQIGSRLRTLAEKQLNMALLFAEAESVAAATSSRVASAAAEKGWSAPNRGRGETI
jgi:hypothetical protein